MFRFLTLCLMAFALAIPANASANDYDPLVFCDQNGEHGDNPDAVDDDVELLRDALLATYPYLSPEFQAHAREAPFFIDHSWTPATKLYMGWSAEDDPDYVYEDGDEDGRNRLLFPAGMIKSNCSERCTQLLLLIRDELGGIRNHEGARAYVLAFFVHEFTHDMQYMNKPVRDLKSGLPGEVCPKGLCDRDLVAETRTKIGYESDAFIAMLEFLSDENLVSLVKSYDAVVAAKPELFVKGGKYGLLRTDFAQYYMKSMRTIREAGGIAGSAVIVYHGQYRIPELAWELYLLAEKDHVDYLDVMNLLSQWMEFMDQGSDTVKLRGVGSYIGFVEERFHQDLGKAIVQALSRNSVDN